MSLEENFNEINQISSRCKTCAWYDNLQPEDKAFFDKKSKEIVSGDGGITKLWQACRKNGLEVSATSFRDHFNAHATR